MSKKQGDKQTTPLMKFRLLSGGFDQMDPSFKEMGTLELREQVLEKRGIGGMDEVDGTNERISVEQMTRSALLKELGAYQRFRADASTGYQPIIETDKDLEKWNRNKFARLQDDSPRVIEKVVEKRVAVDLEDMTLDELRAFAAEEEIELPEGIDSKGKALQVIRSSRRKK